MKQAMILLRGMAGKGNGIPLTLGDVITLTKIIEKTSISVKLLTSAFSIIMVPWNKLKSVSF